MQVRVAWAISSVEAYGKQTLSEPLQRERARRRGDARSIVRGHLLEPLAGLLHVGPQELAVADDVDAHAVALQELTDRSISWRRARGAR